MSRIEARRDEDTVAAGPLVDRLLGGLPPEAVLTDPDITVVSNTAGIVGGLGLWRE